MIATAIPSPSVGVWHLGPVPLRAYGIIMVTAMAVAVWYTGKRYRKRGGDPELMYDVALWAIPLGIIGARLYHVLSSPAAYFGEGGDPWLALQIWRGGLGVWGGVAFGALGAWIAVKRAGQRLGPIADSIAPALLVAQAIGRWGNWFNQELFGGPTTLPWGLQIDDAHLPAGFESGTLFHPTFLYECLWNLAMAALIVWIDRRRTFKSGQVFGLYLMAYTLGRAWIEYMRIDEAEHILGVRLNVWTSILIFALGVAVFVFAGKRGASTALLPHERPADDEDGAQSDGLTVSDPQDALGLEVDASIASVEIEEQVNSSSNLEE
ncbi:prolipoprotein diacylglyceryl transferase [Schaalia vaccimaxillae]|uniref:prolipoprotein diacylglyceryl transferase n=1 Tax=Schaalia vaccimaxillae TaxID=183916 RepID=UPI0003B73109|nr:prolipoprotein diacylglyceryl transferase [Schaalia vaccimaxillae]